MMPRRLVARFALAWNRTTRNDVTISEPTPATGGNVAGEGDEGATNRRASSRVPVDGGIMRTRFSGFAKNRNTRSTGNGTQSEK